MQFEEHYWYHVILQHTRTQRRAVRKSLGKVALYVQGVKEAENNLTYPNPALGHYSFSCNGRYTTLVHRFERMLTFLAFLSSDRVRTPDHDSNTHSLQLGNMYFFEDSSISDIEGVFFFFPNSIFVGDARFFS